MRFLSRNAVLALALLAGLSPLALRAAQALTNYTGTVSDDMCGASHASMAAKGMSDADCVRMCVKGGSAYALVVGQRAYTLKTTDKQQAALLDKFAGKRVTVSGMLNGTTLTVHRVEPGR